MNFGKHVTFFSLLIAFIIYVAVYSWDLGDNPPLFSIDYVKSYDVIIEDAHETYLKVKEYEAKQEKKVLFMEESVYEGYEKYRDHIKPEPENHHNSEESGHRDTMDFSMTSYTAFCDTGCIGVTRTGYDVSETIYSPSGRRVIAVDPNVIPLHSIVKVYPEYGLEPFKAKALDTGGAIQGNIIDLLVSNTDRAMYLGRQDIEIEVVRWGK